MTVSFQQAMEKMRRSHESGMTVADHLSNADMCRGLALSAHSDSMRQMLLTAADHWETLARITQEHSSGALIGNYARETINAIASVGAASGKPKP